MKKMMILLVGLAFVLTLTPQAAAKTVWPMHPNYPPNNFHQTAGHMDRESVKTLKDNGMTILEVNKSFRKELNAVGKEPQAEWAGKAGEDAKEVLDRYCEIISY